MSDDDDDDVVVTLVVTIVRPLSQADYNGDMRADVQRAVQRMTGGEVRVDWSHDDG